MQFVKPLSGLNRIGNLFTLQEFLLRLFIGSYLLFRTLLQLRMHCVFCPNCEALFSGSNSFLHRNIYKFKVTIYKKKNSLANLLMLLLYAILRLIQRILSFKLSFLTIIKLLFCYNAITFYIIIIVSKPRYLR